ncbi:BZ3500_MvSof-1268-A1-R1_Chr2-1g04624 [Microbotryum saponariae]|uniref:BZ3500_MvSof-1268-A1-R1_Chr2-1g04624 protein n=1 Tax=Microbotryum saponariae TaxID=289078 RepID=A0A2X0MIV5_9BASI|nr:BZ3500_MvSof-1268-A1-R1_Chr2-1g04624 [Microbotryum saponariae]SCZ92144.1 BZ3501_MvSof-1269-A2-R1_Chr2-1g04280 [Microbotryum saponariae]
MNPTSNSLATNSDPAPPFVAPLPTPPTSSIALPRVASSTTKFVPSTKPQRRTKVFHAVDFFATADGREAGLRFLQYSLRFIRFILYLRRHKLSTPLLSRLLALVSTLSAIRRLVALVDLTRYIYHSWDPFHHLRNRRKGKGKSAHPDDDPSLSSSWGLVPELSTLLHLTRQSFDLVSTLSDNIYLFSKLNLIPLSKRRTRQADRIADVATLMAALIGLLQVARSRQQIWDEGRAARKEAIKLEERLESFECWEPSSLKVVDVGEPSGTEGVGVGEELRNGLRQERRLEEKMLRERVRNERRRLKALREELTDLWWERLRLTSDGVFAVWDVLDLDVMSEMIKSWAGLTSSAIMMSQAWRDFVPVTRKL